LVVSYIYNVFSVVLISLSISLLYNIAIYKFRSSLALAILMSKSIRSLEYG